MKKTMDFFLLHSYEYVEPPDYSYGAYENGSWNGLVGMLARSVRKIFHQFYL